MQTVNCATDGLELHVAVAALWGHAARYLRTTCVALVQRLLEEQQKHQQHPLREVVPLSPGSIR